MDLAFPSLSPHTTQRWRSIMQNTITVLAKSVYGKDTFYPACAHSEMLCALMETKTLTKRALDTLKRAGYEIAFKPNY